MSPTTPDWLNASKAFVHDTNGDMICPIDVSAVVMQTPTMREPFILIKLSGPDFANALLEAREVRRAQKKRRDPPSTILMDSFMDESTYRALGLVLLPEMLMTLITELTRFALGQGHGAELIGMFETLKRNDHH